MLNETHDPGLSSWLASAQAPDCDFPVQNLPFAVFRRRGSSESFRGGVALGDQIVDLSALASAGVLDGEAQRAALAGSQTKLNALMALGPVAWSALRLALSRALRVGSRLQAAIEPLLHPQNQAKRPE